jgi:hypothetical protein
MQLKNAMITNTGLSIPVSSKSVKQLLSVPATSALSDSTQKTLAAPPAKAAPKASLLRDLFSFTVDALDLHSWRDMNPMACILLAGFIAVVAEPLVHDGLAGRLVALMTSMK